MLPDLKFQYNFEMRRPMRKVAKTYSFKGIVHSLETCLEKLADLTLSRSTRMIKHY